MKVNTYLHLLVSLLGLGLLSSHSSFATTPSEQGVIHAHFKITDQGILPVDSTASVVAHSSADSVASAKTDSSVTNNTVPSSSSEHLASTARHFEQEGIASWYGNGFQGKRTASGETFDKNAFTAAHRKLPLHSLVRVTQEATGKSVVVRINDRGPFHSNRIIDLSYGAAKQLGITQQGKAKVKIEVIGKDVPTL